MGNAHQSFCKPYECLSDANANLHGASDNGSPMESRLPTSCSQVRWGADRRDCLRGRDRRGQTAPVTAKAAASQGAKTQLAMQCVFGQKRLRGGECKMVSASTICREGAAPPSTLVGKWPHLFLSTFPLLAKIPGQIWWLFVSSVVWVERRILKSE